MDDYVLRLYGAINLLYLAGEIAKYYSYYVNVTDIVVTRVRCYQPLDC